MLNILIEFDSLADYLNMQKQPYTKADIMSTVYDLVRTAKRENINGQLYINALQVGGDKSKLEPILPLEQFTGNRSFNQVKCDILDADNCKEAVNNAFYYMVQHFPSQYDFDQQNGLESFGIGYATKNDITELGLDRINTVITKDDDSAQL